MLNNNVKKYMVKLAKPIASFDFKDAFDTFNGKGKALQLINEGFDVIIVSQLNESARGYVESIIKRTGIPVSKIYFTNGQDKWNTLIKIPGVRRHYDSNQNQLDKIKKYLPSIQTIKT